MTTLKLHPWASTPEAVSAARKAVQIPLSMMTGKALLVGTDELHSEALKILAECALPHREPEETVCATCSGSLEGVRAGAKFCTPKCRMAYAKKVQRKKHEALPPRDLGHVGSMWEWPETDMSKYAIRQIGYCLNNYLRSCTYGIETPVSYEAVVKNSADMYAPETDETPADILSCWLETRGVQTTGDESFEELAEAVKHVRGDWRDPVELLVA